MIGIFSANHQSTVRGPQKVVLNLLKGLDLINEPYKINSLGDLNGCLNSYKAFVNNLPSDTMMGPNLVVNPPDDVNLFNKFKKILVPSKFVMDNYYKFDEAKDTNIVIHPTGIDTDVWVEDKTPTRDCLIYFKQREENELILLKEKLDSLNITYHVIKYGSYREEELKMKLTDVKFCILLTGTESQGIGYMEILSTNTPCFVYNFIYDDGKLYGASTPYFNEQCGIIYNGEISKSDDDLISFIDSLNSFTPREYIMSDFTLIKSAEKYIKLLKK